MASNDMQSLITKFFTTHLPVTRGFSRNTVSSYRDSFVLFLRWLEDERGIPADALTFGDLTAEAVESFLSDLGARCASSTCNNRLAAIKSFCRYAQRECPDACEACAEVLGVPARRCPEPSVDYLSADGIAAILRSAESSLRDLALLSVMYDLGARVQETCDLNVGHLALGPKATAVVTGKGCKTRIVPMAPQVASIVRKYIGESSTEAGAPLFTSAGGRRIGRSGVAYVLLKHAKRAHSASPGLVPPKVTPHMLRHSKAMHLLESGVNLIYIRDFLGHSSVTTTEIYAKANPEAKRIAAERASSLIVYGSAYDEKTQDDLISWLKRHI